MTALRLLSPAALGDRPAEQYGHSIQDRWSPAPRGTLPPITKAKKMQKVKIRFECCAGTPKSFNFERKNRGEMFNNALGCCPSSAFADPARAPSETAPDPPPNTACEAYRQWWPAIKDVCERDTHVKGSLDLRAVFSGKAPEKRRFHGGYLDRPLLAGWKFNYVGRNGLILHYIH